MVLSCLGLSVITIAKETRHKKGNLLVFHLSGTRPFNRPTDALGIDRKNVKVVSSEIPVLGAFALEARRATCGVFARL